MGNIVNKSHEDHAVGFDQGQVLAFDNVASVTANHALSVRVGWLPLPQDLKIMKVTLQYSALAGSPAVQIVAGPGTAVAVPTFVGTTPPDAAPAAINVAVFNAPVCLTNAVDTPQTIYPANIDIPYAGSFDAVGGNNQLTLRYLSGAGDTASNLKVTLFVKPLDPNPTAEPYSPTTS